MSYRLRALRVRAKLLPSNGFDGPRHHDGQQASGRSLDAYISFMTSQATPEPVCPKLSLPIWASSYDDPAVTKDQEELIAAAKVGLTAMYPRPTTPKYQELSTALQQAIRNRCSASPRRKMH